MKLIGSRKSFSKFTPFQSCCPFSGTVSMSLTTSPCGKRIDFLDFGHFETRVIDNVHRAYPDASVSLRRPGFIKIPGLSRLSAIFTQYREIKKTIQEKKIDVIVLYAVATNGLQTVQLARKAHIPVVFRSIDILHRLVPHRFLRPIVKQLEKKIYAEVDLILPHTPKEVEYLISMGAKEAKIKPLPYPLETNLFRPSSISTELQRKWGFEKQDKIIFFQGTLYDFSGLDIFLREFPALLKASPGSQIVIGRRWPTASLIRKYHRRT